MSVVQILAILLAAALVGNAVQCKTYLGARDSRVKAEGARDQARAAATACTKGVQALEAAADAREHDSERARQLAKSAATGHAQRAQQILAAPASTPGDACKSANDAIDKWLAGRSRP